MSTTSAGTSGFVLLASDVDWISYSDAARLNGDGAVAPVGPSLGPARPVCVTSFNPANCPPGALVYGSPSTPWRVGAQLPAAHWIWRADVANPSPADLQTAAFQKTVSVGPGATGSLLMGADDSAGLYVGDVFVGGLGSITNYQTASQAQNVLTTFDLTAALAQSVPNGGNVTLTVVAQNGPGAFGNGCAPQGCDYSENPAGVIFYGKIVW